MLRGGRAPLVGRGRELALLEDCLAAARDGQGASFIALIGEPGIGKSRLLEEFPGAESRVTVLRGGSSQAQGLPPYLPFVEAIGDYVASAPRERLREEFGDSAAALANLLPGLVERLGSIAPAYPLSPEQERLRLYEGVVAFLRRLCATDGVVLSLDDLHWADASTFDLVVHVARRLARANLVIVGAFRQAEASGNTGLQRTLTELNHLRLLQSVELAPLALSETAELASGLLGGDVDPEVGQTLHLHAEGNPFFVEELGRALVENGSLAQHAGRWRLTTQPLVVLPQQVASALRQRLSHLDAKAVGFLQVAATIGRVFSVRVLVSATSSTSDEVEESLLVATRAQLVRPQPDGTFAFSHDKVREVLEADLAPGHRTRVHRQIAETLERESADTGLDARGLSELAFHFQAAGEDARGADYAIRAGEDALRSSAAVEAIRHFQIATDLLASRSDPQRRAEVQLRLGEAHSLAGHYREAAESHRRAAATALKIGATASAAEGWRRVADAEWRQERLEPAREAFERSIALAQSVHRDAEAADTLLRLAELLAMSLGQHARGMAEAERALDLVRGIADRRLEAMAYRVIGNLKLRTLELAEAERLLERALDIAMDIDDPALGAETCAHLANLYALTSNPRRSFELTDLRETLGKRTQDPFQLRDVDSWRALLCVTWGDWAGAERFLALGEAAASELETPQPMIAVHWARGELRRNQGRYAEAESAFRAAVELARPIGDTPLCWYLGGLGVALAEQGRADEALGYLNELFGIATARQPLAVERGYAFAYLALGFERIGERARAAACYADLLPYRGLNEEVIIDFALGVSAACAGDAARALPDFAAAEQIARRGGIQPQLVLTLMWQAGLEPARGAALEEGQRLGLALQMEEPARRALQSARSAARAMSKDQLSARQLEVLRLVVQGRSNREIAEDLVLTEGTVANHVSAIFSRLGVENRAAAVALAVRRGIA